MKNTKTYNKVKERRRRPREPCRGRSVASAPATTRPRDERLLDTPPLSRAALSIRSHAALLASRHPPTIFVRHAPVGNNNGNYTIVVAFVTFFFFFYTAPRADSVVVGKTSLRWCWFCTLLSFNIKWSPVSNEVHNCICRIRFEILWNIFFQHYRPNKVWPHVHIKFKMLSNEVQMLVEAWVWHCFEWNSSLS